MPDTLRWGIIGTGSICRKFAEGLKDGKKRKLYIYQVSDHERKARISPRSPSGQAHRRANHSTERAAV